MPEGRYVSYLRVSTAKQGASGLGLDAQREAVRLFLAGGELTAELTEIESGKRNDRPQLACALRLCRLTGATLLVAKLDRLARNMAFTANLMDSGVDFVACDNPHATRFTIHILAAVAEHEARQISARTRAALAAAKARGVPLGGWRGAPGGPLPFDGALGVQAVKRNADAYAAELAPIVAEIQAAGLSLRATAAELTRRGIRTPRNAATWSAGTVRAVLARAPAAGCVGQHYTTRAPAHARAHSVATNRNA